MSGTRVLFWNKVVDEKYLRWRENVCVEEKIFWVKMNGVAEVLHSLLLRHVLMSEITQIFTGAPGPHKGPYGGPRPPQEDSLVYFYFYKYTISSWVRSCCGSIIWRWRGRQSAIFWSRARDLGSKFSRPGSKGPKKCRFEFRDVVLHFVNFSAGSAVQLLQSTQEMPTQPLWLKRASF